MTIFFNLSSLILGLASWTLALAALFRRDHSFYFMSTSFACCALSLLSQFFELRHRILTCDLSAVLDIYPAMAWIAGILVLGTLALNALALFRFRSR